VIVELGESHPESSNGWKQSGCQID
jgi:hypothetical protein